MATKLRNALKREIAVDGKAFIVTVAPDALRLVGKGRRKGLELAWTDLIDGDAALATALHATLDQRLHLEPASKGNKIKKRRREAT